MRTLPPEPSPGDKITANLIRDIIRAIRERTPISGPGVKLSSGPDGTVISSESKCGSEFGSTDNSCFRFGTVEVEGEDEETGETTTEKNQALVCCYYNVGGITKHMDDADVEEIVPKEDDEGVSYLCLKLTGTQKTPSVVLIDGDDLLDEQSDPANYVRPLYRYEDGVLTDDLRNAPQTQYVEVI